MRSDWRRRCLLVSLAALVGLLAGCAKPLLVRDADESDAVSGWTLNCRNYYEFVQDCSFWLGPKRKISLAGVNFKAAATADGKTIIITGPNPIFDDHDKITNTAYELVKRELLKNRINIEQVRPVIGVELTAYILVTDGDAYGILKAYSI